VRILFFFLPFSFWKKRVEDEILDMCAWSGVQALELDGMHGWTRMLGCGWHSSFLVGLVWSDSNGLTTSILFFCTFRQTKTAGVDLLFKISRKFWSRSLAMS
jgi:hypothetical protein